jgi:adenine-specific DNA-methyltransferase
MIVAKKSSTKTIETLTHDADKRKNIPTAEFQSVLEKEQQAPKKIRYPRNTDLDPQLVWRGKDEQDWSDLVVHAPPLYIQEKVHPKALIDDLLRQTKEREHHAGQLTADLFADFNGIPTGVDKTEFYQHDQNWSNRMILGDSLQVMASLAEREGMRGKVQCIYIDPPYGIKFNSNFQWSTTSRDVKDGKADHITREPEQVKAFRDTWRDGIHSYLTYLRDRLTVARDLLTESGSIFVQIGDENVHRVRAVMDEVFGEDNIVCEIVVAKTTGATSELLPPICDYVLCFAKKLEAIKYRQLFSLKVAGELGATGYTKVRLADGSIRPLTASDRADSTGLPPGSRILATGDLTSQRPPGDFPVAFKGRTFRPIKGYWKTGESGFGKIIKAQRVYDTSGGRLSYIRYIEDFPAFPITNLWTDTVGQNQFGGDKIYVVQTANRIVERCILMATDPGDLVLDPTCGSGTTATVAEHWGRRWITIDTSRVALALARARIMGARYPFYLLADSREGQIKEAEVTRTAPSSRCAETSAMASSMSACHTSRSNLSPTTQRLMSSGTSGRRSWSRCARH